MLSHHTALKSLFSRQVLDGALMPDFGGAPDAALLDTQGQALGGLCRQSNLDAISVCLVRTDASFAIESITAEAQYGLPISELEAHRPIDHLDPLRKAVLRTPGTAVFNTDFRSLDAWRQDPLYNPYYARLGVLHAASISFIPPFRENMRLQVSFFAKSNGVFSPDFSKSFIELAGFPMAIFWLARFGAIDTAHLSRMRDLLSHRKPIEIAILRELVTLPQYSLDEISARVGLSARKTDYHLAECHKSIQPILAGDAPVGRANRLLDLAAAFQLLRIMGPSRGRRKNSQAPRIV
ncbi:MAG: hypothetical protein AAF429_13370 [Pseudomonadota bacterium]